MEDLHGHDFSAGMQAFFSQVKLHAFYLTALWLWGGIVIVLKWWVAFDCAACLVLAMVAVAIRMISFSGRRSSQVLSEPAATV